MTRTILLVDDSEHDQLAHRRALRESGHNIATAQTLATGLAFVAEHGPDVVLLDYNLPDGNGLEFLRGLNEQAHDLAPTVVMLTGSGDERVAVDAMKAGANDYLIKDVTGGHLRLLPAVVERALRERAERVARREARRQLQLAASVYETITEGILVTEPDGTIVSVNPGLCRMTGYAPAELVGGTPRILKSTRHAPAFYQTMWACIHRDGSWRGDVWNSHKNGSLFLVCETVTALRDSHGRVTNYVAVLFDITEAKQAEEKIQHQAHHDPLTGLPNRSLFMDRLRHQIAYAHRQDKAFAVLFIDLDGFKTVNDELGHEAGDDLLKQVAARLADRVRESDTLARLGGDEFTAILNDLAEPGEVVPVVRKMLEHLCEPFYLGPHERRISASIGIALYPSDGVNADALLKAADQVMYQVKRGGKSAFAFVDGLTPS